MKTLNPAPESVVQLNIYKYMMGCSTLRCKCKKKGFAWTEMCLCKDCENTDSELEVEEFLEHQD